MLGVFVKGFRFPDFFDVLATWIAIASLFMIGTFNVFNLLRTAGTGGEFQIRGLKGKLLPRIMRETTNPFLIVILGGLFALAADTVSQTSLWALSAANSADYMPFILGGVFMAGMMLTDTLDSLIAYRLISQSGQIGQSTSRLIGWFIVALAYGIASYEAFSFFFPVLDIDFEVVGIICFVFLLSCLAAVAIRRKIKAA
jgi:high-affinity nickel-transport protein